VERHASLNSSWGVISTDALDGLSDESVSTAFRLFGKRDDKPFPLRTVFLTCEVPDLPSHVYLDDERVSPGVCPEPYVVLQVSEIRAHTAALYL
jgi:hypothetical protein